MISQSPLRAASSAIIRKRWPSMHVSSSTRCRRRQRSVHTTTDMPSHYYDSQSGRHVPIHDESKIAAYYYSAGLPAKSPTTILDDVKTLGLANALILNSNVEDVSKVRSFIGTVFLSSQLFEEEERADDASNINLCFDLDAYENTDDKAAFEKNMSAAAQTSIGLFAPKYFTGEVDPVLSASMTASLMDATGGGDFILLLPRMTEMDESCGDAMVQLCEELSYLDVEGPTIKSRLIVSAMDDDQVEECLAMGISKYFVGDETGLNMLQQVVEEQGKQLMLK